MPSFRNLIPDCLLASTGTAGSTSALHDFLVSVKKQESLSSSSAHVQQRDRAQSPLFSCLPQLCKRKPAMPVRPACSSHAAYRPCKVAGWYDEHAFGSRDGKLMSCRCRCRAMLSCVVSVLLAHRQREVVELCRRHAKASHSMCRMKFCAWGCASHHI